MKTLLVDLDSKRGFANLALMKISTYHKSKGDDVTLTTLPPKIFDLTQSFEAKRVYDKAYISCIYEENKEKAQNLARKMRSADIEVSLGGSGVNLKKDLADEIEHLMPDYSLYDLKHSMGFTSRGCIRRCPWCIVPKKEGRITDHAPIEEFLHPEHEKVILLDNNFQASPNWKRNLEHLIENNIKVNFNQGLDIRLLTKEFCETLSRTRYYDWKFKGRRIHFAFDDLRYEKNVIKGIEILSSAGIPPRRLMFYILVGFNSTIEEDLYRIRKIVDLGADPYIMRFNKTKGEDKILLHLARWVNWRVHKKITFRKYHSGQSQKTLEKKFGPCPDPYWEGYSCPHGGYAWANYMTQRATKESKPKEKPLVEVFK